MSVYPYNDYSISNLLAQELTEICKHCFHEKDCILRKESSRIIIQCEVFSNAKPVSKCDAPQRGLCEACCRVSYCTIPKENSGVWRCADYSELEPTMQPC